jgi:hypothetical protein
MNRSQSIFQLTFCLLLAIGINLQGCASKGEPEPQKKIGMHIDAVLEFIVEYPLSWSKDRRLDFGSKHGEVRWTHPGYPQTLLRIKSYIPKQQTLSVDQQIDHVLHEYSGLEVLTKEVVTLPAGDAWHIMGHTVQAKVEIYLILRTGRSYSIELTAPRYSIDDDEDVMDRITQSFQIMP